MAYGLKASSCHPLKKFPPEKHQNYWGIFFVVVDSEDNDLYDVDWEQIHNCNFKVTVSFR